MSSSARNPPAGSPPPRAAGKPRLEAVTPHAINDAVEAAHLRPECRVFIAQAFDLAAQFLHLCNEFTPDARVLADLQLPHLGALGGDHSADLDQTRKRERAPQPAARGAARHHAGEDSFDAAHARASPGMGALSGLEIR